MQRRVLVLLSTYNGIKYLREQIESILAQEQVEVSILIRDDGSTDNTKQLLNDYCSKYNNISLIASSDNLRPGNSFMELIYYAGQDCFEKYDYYALADQDDIWLKNKLFCAIKKIEDSKDTAQPILYCSNQILYKNEKECGVRYIHAPRIDLPSVINSNKVSGCTFVMNKCLLMKICSAPHPSRKLMLRRMHDVWIVLAAICSGELIYDNKSYILYRIHENNVVGIKRTSMIERMRIYCKNLSDKEYGNYRSWTASEIKHAFPEVKGKNREILEELSGYRKSIKLKKKLLCDYDTLRKIDNGAFAAVLKILFNVL